MGRLRDWLLRWQEHWWLLGLAAAALAAWVVIGALDRTATADALALLMQLPLVSLLALAACALAYLFRRRSRRKLSDAEQSAWWSRLMDHPHGAVIVYVVDMVFSLCVLALLLHFFSRSL